MGENLSRDEMGTLKFCLVGRWENPPDSYPSAMEMEAWAKRGWRLKGNLMVAYMNQDLMFMEFTNSDEAEWVLESGRRWLRGGSLAFDWWNPESGCVKSTEKAEEDWIRVVGLPLHLCRHEVLKKIGDNCGGFLAIDKAATLRTKVLWARILVKAEGKVKPSVVNILEGVRSYELQIWFELQPNSTRFLRRRAGRRTCMQ